MEDRTPVRINKAAAPGVEPGCITLCGVRRHNTRETRKTAASISLEIEYALLRTLNGVAVIAYPPFCTCAFNRSTNSG